MWRWARIAGLAGAWLAWSDAWSGRPWGLALLGIAVAMIAFRSWRHVERRRRARAVDGLRQLTPSAFEEEVARWLRREGYHVETRGGTGDGGIDLVARRGSDVLSVQCKRYAEHAAVSAAQVRDLYGAAMAERSTAALLVTTGRVSRAARTWCEQLPEGLAVTLVDLAGIGDVAVGRRELAGS